MKHDSPLKTNFQIFGELHYEISFSDCVDFFYSFSFISFFIYFFNEFLRNYWAPFEIYFTYAIEYLFKLYIKHEYVFIFPVFGRQFCFVFQ